MVAELLFIPGDRSNYWCLRLCTLHVILDCDATGVETPKVARTVYAGFLTEGKRAKNRHLA